MKAGKEPARKLNARQLHFASLVATGTTNASAYRTAYGKGKIKSQLAAEKGCRLAAHAGIAAEIARIRGRAEVKKLLTLNDRLGILAEVAQSDGSTPAARNAKVRACEVYSRISGDQAPDRHEHTGPGGAAIPVAAAVTGNVTAAVVRVPVRERIRLLKEAQARDKAAQEARVL